MNDDLHIGTEITVNRIILKCVYQNDYNCPSPLLEFIIKTLMRYNRLAEFRDFSILS